MKIKENIAGIAEIAAAVILTVGSFTFFRACDSAEGRHMACHWAQNTITLIGIVLTVQALLRILIPDKKTKVGLSLGIFLLSIAAIFVPGTVIDLCMMDTMECHTVFRPAVIVVATLSTVISGVDSVFGLVRSGKIE